MTYEVKFRLTKEYSSGIHLKSRGNSCRESALYDNAAKDKQDYLIKTDFIVSYKQCVRIFDVRPFTHS